MTRPLPRIAFAAVALLAAASLTGCLTLPPPSPPTSTPPAASPSQTPDDALDVAEARSVYEAYLAALVVTSRLGATSDVLMAVYAAPAIAEQDLGELQAIFANGMILEEHATVRAVGMLERRGDSFDVLVCLEDTQRYVDLDGSTLPRTADITAELVIEFTRTSDGTLQLTRRTLPTAEQVAQCYP